MLTNARRARPNPKTLISLASALMLATGLMAQTPDWLGAAGAANVQEVHLTNPSDTDLIARAENVTVGVWDGSVEDGYRYINLDSGDQSEFVQLLTMPTDSGTITGFRFCLRLTAPRASIPMDLVFYRASGGQPTNEFMSIPVTGGSTNSGTVCFIGDSSINGIPMNVSQRRFFFGVRFPELSGVFMGADEDGRFTSPGYSRVHPGNAWNRMGENADFPNYRNLAVEVEFEANNNPPPPTGTCPVSECTPGPNNLCLGADDRFEVRANARNLQDELVPVEFAPKLTPDTGYGHYGNPDNLEIFAKVLRVCAPGFDNDFWVFIGGLTDLEVTVEICDTEAGVQKTYRNPPRTPFETVADTDAFSTCP